MVLFLHQSSIALCNTNLCICWITVSSFSYVSKPNSLDYHSQRPFLVRCPSIHNKRNCRADSTVYWNAVSKLIRFDKPFQFNFQTVIHASHCQAIGQGHLRKQLCSPARVCLRSYVYVCVCLVLINQSRSFCSSSHLRLFEQTTRSLNRQVHAIGWRWSHKNSYAGASRG